MLAALPSLNNSQNDFEFWGESLNKNVMVQEMFNYRLGVNLCPL